MPEPETSRESARARAVRRRATSGAVIALGAVTLAAAIGGEARAADVSRLEYTAPAGACPDEQGFRDLVAARMNGVDPFAGALSDAPAARTVVTIRRVDRAYEGTIDRFDHGAAAGTRKLGGQASCARLAEDLATSVVLMVRPLVLPKPPASPTETPAPTVAPPPPPAPAPPSTSTPALPAPPAAPAATAPLPSPTPRPRIRIGAGPTVAFGTEPAPSIGVSALVGVRWSLFSIDVEGRYDAPSSTAGRPGGGSVSASLAAGSLVPCVHARWFVGCAVVSAGAARISASVEPETHTRPYVGAGLRAGVEIPIIDPLVIQLAGDGLIAIVRPSASIDSVPVWQAPPVSGLLGIRLVASF